MGSQLKIFQSRDSLQMYTRFYDLAREVFIDEQGWPETSLVPPHQLNSLLDQNYYFLFEWNGQDIGCIRMTPNQKPYPYENYLKHHYDLIKWMRPNVSACSLGALAVRQTFRGRKIGVHRDQSIGRVLTQTALAWASAHEQDLVVCLAGVVESATHFYREGFKLMDPVIDFGPPVEYIAPFMWSRDPLLSRHLQNCENRVSPNVLSYLQGNLNVSRSLAAAYA